MFETRGLPECRGQYYPGETGEGSSLEREKFVSLTGVRPE